MVRPSRDRPTWALKKLPEFGLPVEEREPGSESSLGPSETEVDAPFEEAFDAGKEIAVREEAAVPEEAGRTRSGTAVR